MRKRWIQILALAAYSVVLIRVVVFKAIPVIRIGHLRFRLGGHHSGPPNLVPLRTLASYLHGGSGRLIAAVNLLGNIALLVPVGLLGSRVYRRMTWQMALILAVSVGLALEGMEALFHIGIFDVDDVILNAMGVMIGYGISAYSRLNTNPR